MLADCTAHSAAEPRWVLLYDLPLLLLSAVAQPLAALLPYGCGTPLAGAALPVLRQCGLITVYRCTHQCGERSNAAFGRQSAAVLPSLAPHDSKARLQDVTKRRDSWRSHVHRTYIAQRVQSFKLQTANVGGRGVLPSRSLGGQRGPFSHVREWPPYPHPHMVWSNHNLVICTPAVFSINFLVPTVSNATSSSASPPIGVTEMTSPSPNVLWWIWSPEES